MEIKISELQLGFADAEAVVPATNSEGTATNKIKLGDIANLGVFAPGSGANSIVGGQNNVASGDHSSVLAGHDNDTDEYENAHIIGSNITALSGNATFVNSLKVLGNSYAEGGDKVEISSTGITFPDGTVKTTAGSKVIELTYASTLNTDASLGDLFDVTLTGAATLANPTNPVNGQTLRWRITQDATGGRAVTLGNKFAIPSSATSPLPFSTDANKMDILAATYHAGRDKWDIVAFVMGY